MLLISYRSTENRSQKKLARKFSLRSAQRTKRSLGIMKLRRHLQKNDLTKRGLICSARVQNITNHLLIRNLQDWASRVIQILLRLVLKLQNRRTKLSSAKCERSKTTQRLLIISVTLKQQKKILRRHALAGLLQTSMRIRKLQTFSRS